MNKAVCKTQWPATYDQEHVYIRSKYQHHFQFSFNTQLHYRKNHRKESETVLQWRQGSVAYSAQLSELLSTAQLCELLRVKATKYTLKRVDFPQHTSIDLSLST